MKGTAVAVVVGGAVTVSLQGCGNAACEFQVPKSLQQQGARMASFSCDVSESCCKGLQAAETLVTKAKGQGKGVGKADAGPLTEDLVGTCGRADQVGLYKCAVATLPKLASAGKGESKAKAMIKGKGCDNVAAKTGTDGDGKCNFEMGHGKGSLVIDGVSTGCCDAANTAAKSYPGTGSKAGSLIGITPETCDICPTDDFTPDAIAMRHKNGTSYTCQGMKDLMMHHSGIAINCNEMRDQIEEQCCASGSKAGSLIGTGGVPDEKAVHEATCGMIGACGKKDQLSVMKFVTAMKGKGKGNGMGGGPLELLETFDMTNGGAQQMMATFMTSEAEDDVSEDGATEDGSQIVTGLLGFVAGAAVTGLGVTVLRRSTPSQYEYNEIVA